MRPTIKEVTALLVYLKKQIGDDYRASEDSEDDAPGMLVTIATNDAASEWSYQTGDNSYTGGCYQYPHWELIYLYRDSNCRDLAKSAVSNLLGTASDLTF